MVGFFSLDNERKPLNISFILCGKPVVSRQKNIALRSSFLCFQNGREDYLAFCKRTVNFFPCILQCSGRVGDLWLDHRARKKLQIFFKLPLALRSIPDFPIDILGYSFSARFLYFLFLLGICLCKSPAGY